MNKIFDSEQTKDVISKLSEREKELKCLYKVQSIINDNLPLEAFLLEIAKHMWGGWQYPMITRVKITFEGKVYKEPGWEETEWMQQSNLIIDGMVLGKIEVFYTRFVKLITDSQFLPEEQKLLDTIADKVSSYIFSRRLKRTIEALEQQEDDKKGEIENGKALLPVQTDIHWLWRHDMATIIAEKTDLEKFGIKAIYLIGSAKNANSGPASDIDLMVHFKGNSQQENEMRCWFDGWSQCLSEVNLSRTGYKTDGLLDLHVITDEDIRKKTSYAVMIGRASDGARLLKKRQ
jgi:hypothetical protein